MVPSILRNQNRFWKKKEENGITSLICIAWERLERYNNIEIKSCFPATNNIRNDSKIKFWTQLSLIEMQSGGKNIQQLTRAS